MKLIKKIVVGTVAVSAIALLVTYFVLDPTFVFALVCAIILAVACAVKLLFG